MVYKALMTNNGVQNLRFSATLVPHRSLPANGFFILICLVAGVSFVCGVAFMMMGAWPVFGFFGLDVALVYWAFKRNYADARCAEIIEVTDRELVVKRLAENRPVRETRLVRHWVRVELIEDVERDLIGALRLHSHGRAYEIARFLDPVARKNLALELKGALAGA